MTGAHNPINQVLTILAVEDLPRAVGFYVQAFSWEQTVDAPTYAEFKMPNAMRLGLYKRDGFAINTGVASLATPPDFVSGTELYFYPADLNASIKRMEAAGARLLKPLAQKDWGDEAVYYADPDRNVVVLARPLVPQRDRQRIHRHRPRY